MKVGILTFHSAHNYGSMLQAFALHKVVSEMGHDCEIINFRTERQRQYYKSSLKFWLKSFLSSPLLCRDLRTKSLLFEDFLSRHIALSMSEFHSYRDLEENAQGYDAYISGSDQIWNVGCYDWDKSYCLGFVKSGRKIAYAPSMGPEPESQILSDSRRLSELCQYIKKYDRISVRESKTAEIVGKLTGNIPQTTLDPTLLVPVEKWETLASGNPSVKGEYLLIYTPWCIPSFYKQCVELGRQLGLKIVSTLDYCYDSYRFDQNVIYKVATGPCEFLNLVRNARIVAGASFHAVAFAIIFGKQFYAYKGMDDSRVSSLLNLTGLTEFADLPQRLMNTKELRKLYERVMLKLTEEVNKSRYFLKRALD